MSALSVTPRPGGAVVAAHERLAHLILPCAVLALSFSAVFVRSSESPPQELAALRLVFSAAALFPFAVRRKALGTYTPRTLLLAALSGLALGVHYIVWFDSLRHTSVASSTLLVTLHPLLVVPASYLLWGRRTTALGGVGILAALAGGVLIAGGGLTVDVQHARGDVEAFIAALAMGIYLLIGSSVRRSVGLAPYSAVVYSVGGTFALLIAARLCHVAPAIVSVSILGEPVGSVLLAWLFFGEVPTSWQVAGGTVLLAGVLVFARFGTAGGREHT